MRRVEVVAGNGLLHRRLFLKEGAGLAGLALLRATPAAAGQAQDVPAYMKAPGQGMRPYGERSPYESAVQRLVVPVTGTTGSGSSRTPLEHVEGIITPSALHFERHHSGVPGHPADRSSAPDPRSGRPAADLRPCRAVPLPARLAPALRRVFRQQHRALRGGANPGDRGFAARHGLLQRMDRRTTAHAARGGRSRAGRALARRRRRRRGRDEPQHPDREGAGRCADRDLSERERLRPENGYPMRLLLPGWEGNTNVKWLRRLKVVAEPVMTKDETSKYTDSLPGGKALQFTFPMGVKSVDHVSVRRLDDAGAGFVSDFRTRLVGRGTHPSSRGVGGWRKDMGPGGD